MPVEEIFDELMVQSIDVLRLEEGLVKDALDHLHALRGELEEKVSQFTSDLPERDSYRKQRLQMMLDQTDQSIKSAYKGMDRRHTGVMRELADLEVKGSTAAVNTAIGVNLLTVAVPPEVLAEIAKGSLIQGAPSKKWWARQSATLRQRFSDQMSQGVLQGEDVGALTRRLKGEFTGRYRTLTDAAGKKRRVGIFKGGLMDNSYRQAEAHVRTSVQNVTNRARQELYKKNKSVIKGVQAQATLDSRTSLLCISRSGEAWTNDGDPIPPTASAFPGPPPWHFNCRTVLIPVLRSLEEMMSPEGRKRLGERKVKQLRELDAKMNGGLQASMDGQVPGALNYEQWLSIKDAKDPAFARKVLGPGRYDLWKKEGLSLRDLVDRKGDPYTINQLRTVIKNKQIIKKKVAKKTAKKASSRALSSPGSVRGKLSDGAVLHRSPQGGEWQLVYPDGSTQGVIGSTVRFLEKDAGSLRKITRDDLPGTVYGPGVKSR